MEELHARLKIGTLRIIGRGRLNQKKKKKEIRFHGYKPSVLAQITKEKNLNF
jgi:hypothetical protein